MAKEKKQEERNNASSRLTYTYSMIEDSILKVLRWLFSLIDKYIFNVRYAKIVAVIIAFGFFLAVNYDSTSSLLGTPLLYSREKNGMTLNARYNSEAFEVEGLPQTVDVIISGDSSAVVSAANSTGYISANLEGLTEGTHTIRFSAEGFSSNVKITITPSEAVVTLKPKNTMQFDIGYDFVNQESMNDIYSLGTPVFDSSTANVRASKDTLNSIAFVKALIDVRNVDSDFEQDATLIAYDSKGYPVDCEIVPSTVHVSVPVTSPSKTVPITIDVIGQVPDGQAINTLTLDTSTVMIYASENILDTIENVVVTLDASTITSDTRLLRPITLPAGVTSSSVNQVNVDVTLDQETSKVIEGIPLNYRNNTQGYNISADGYQSNVAVTVYGTQENIESITADNITAYIDFANVQPGVNELAINLETAENPYVRFVLNQETITVNVLGTSSDEVTNEVNSEG